jgi:hypothetical protein
VDREIVLADIRQQVTAGAQHISFGDPDFFNGIKHALSLIEAFHRDFPGITYDVTIKIEHLRKYEEYLQHLRDTGCLLVISAVESVDDHILERLDKGHTREDFLYVARKFRELGMTLHPTFVPFTPWITIKGYLDLLNVIAEEGLVENVAPVQLGIRLLIPSGSRLLELTEIKNMIEPFDQEALCYPWKNRDARVDALSVKVREIASAAERQKESRSATFARIWEQAQEMAGDAERLSASVEKVSGNAVPHISEPWYCCAEPTSEQLVSIGNRGKEKEPGHAENFV